MHRTGRITLAAALILAAAHASAQQAAPLNAPAKAHQDVAKAAQDKINAMCEGALPADLRGKPITTEQARDLGAVPGQLQRPAKVFDNLYFLGVRNVSAWAVQTSAGIILIDALNNPSEAQSAIESGMKTLGLNPADIKYIVITHAHGDHFGGARYLQDKYHPHVLMSDADWKEMAKAKLKPGVTIATRDQTVTDGQTLTLGDETLTLYLTPGHTPGTVSLLIPVKDHGQPHLAALLGGSGAGTNGAQFAASTERFMDIAVKAGADTPMSNHSDVDRAHLKIAMLKTRGAADPHPYVTGKECVRLLLLRRAENAAARGAAQTK